MSLDGILLDRQALINRLRFLEEIVERSGLWECECCGTLYAGCPPQPGLQSTVCKCGGECGRRPQPR
ncbi:MAG TPA: hypothetical protein VGB25_02025 [Candidatus Binatia bacterium]